MSRQRWTTCQVAGCAEEHHARGLCKWHYTRWWIGDHAALRHPRPVTRCVECGASLWRQGMRYCAGCRPVPQGPFVNPLVCVCAEPKADPRVNFGECATCRRKPLALMGVPS